MDIEGVRAKVIVIAAHLSVDLSVPNKSFVDVVFKNDVLQARLKLST